MNFVTAIATFPRIAAKMATLDSDAMRFSLCQVNKILFEAGVRGKPLNQGRW
jgi:hypothetical protein